VSSVFSALKNWRPGRRDARPPEPGSALFRGLHLRLTLWYSGVVVLALVVCGLVLYFGLQDLTFTSVRTTLRGWTDFQTQEWLRTPPQICGQPGAVSPGQPGGRQEPSGRSQPPRPPAPLPVYSACFDTQGQLLTVAAQAPGSGNTTPDAFVDASLVTDALRNGSASDVVDTGEDVGPVLRTATVVRDPSTGQALGVVQEGQSIALQAEALQFLRALLLLLIALATLGSVAGGLLLADRALEPARLAFARQRTFIADASHQLRTPLTLLRADAEVLLRHRDHLEPDDAELLEDIVAETDHMDRLATSLLSLTRLDARPAQIEYDVIDLSELAVEVARRVTTLAEAKKLSVEKELNPTVVLLGDHQAVEQAALILVENAMKYTPSGGAITLRTAAANGHASFIVEDTGVGIPAEQLKHLGERFYRGDPSRTSASGGSGLGLTIAFGIAAAHGGSLRFESTPGQGTKATLSLPTAGPGR
jgi:signal transduction histidine kinase